MGSRGPLPQQKDNAPQGMQYPPGVPKPPADLNRAAKAEYNRMVKVLEPTVQQVDYALVLSYAINHTEFYALSAQVADEGPTLETAKGTVANPAVMAQHRAHQRMKEDMEALGITPAKRARLPQNGNRQDDDSPPAQPQTGPAAFGVIDGQARTG